VHLGLRSARLLARPSTWASSPLLKSRGAVLRARGGGEGPVRGGRGGSMGAHPGLSMVARLGGEKSATEAGTGGHQGCRSGW
jgi:hypothetical protein